MIYEVEILTPLAINNGNEIKSFEIIREGGKSYILDFNKLFENENFVDLVIKSPQILSDENTLKNAFKLLKIDYKKYTKFVLNYPLEKRYNIKEFIKTTGKPFLPGSSLKGSIRTALIKGNNLEEKYKERINLLGKKNEEKINKKFFDKNVEKKLFGDSYGSPFKFLRISDGYVISNHELKIVPIEVLNVRKRRRVLPYIYTEVLDKHTKIKGTIDFRFLDTIKNSEFKDNFKNLQVIDDFVRKVNNGVKKYINDELDLLPNNLRELKEFYLKLLKRMKMLKDNQFIVQVGFSTGYYSKTVVGKLDSNQIKLMKEKRLLDYKVKPEFFPITRRVVKRNGVMEPLGWILVTLKEE